jgi:hypothetical protein
MTVRAQQEQGVDTDLASLASYGLGTPQQFATALTTVTDKLGSTGGFFFAVFFANMFQVVVSALYLFCNNLLTVMVVGSEWDTYVSKRKTLRLSIPKGFQRSSFFLSLPYRYSAILMALSGLLHFFISQSVFVVQTVAYLPKYEPQEFVRASKLDASCIGFSSLGIISSMVIAFLLVSYILFIGFTFKYELPVVEDTNVPLVSTCSAAISANCRRHPADTDCVYLPLQWGIISDMKGEQYTFSSSSDVKPCSRDRIQGNWHNTKDA